MKIFNLTQLKLNYSKSNNFFNFNACHKPQENEGRVREKNSMANSGSKTWNSTKMAGISNGKVGE